MKIREIAKIANVSPATVSLVINGKKGVGESTRKRILSIIDDFGYELKNAVSRKERKIFGTIKVITFSKYSEFLESSSELNAKFVNSITREAFRLGLDVESTSINEQNYSDFFSRINEFDCQGMIFIATEMNTHDIELVSNLDVPCVILDNPIENIMIDSVSTNNVNLMYFAVQHIFKTGNNQIGYFRSSIQLENYKNRYTGFERASTRFGLRFSRENVEFISPSFFTAKKEILSYFDGKTSRPKAFVVDNNIIYAALLSALKSLDLDVEKFSIVVVDDHSSSKILGQRLHTVDNLPSIMAEQATKRIYDKIIYMDQIKLNIKVNPVLKEYI